MSRLSPHRFHLSALSLAAIAVLFSTMALAQPTHPAQAAERARWVASWSASQQIPEPQNALPPDDLRDATLRQIVHLSIGGSTVRVRLSNAFGTAPLRITSAHIARPVALDSPAIDPSTDHALSFAGLPGVVIPPGAEYLSDPVEMPVAALASLTISLHFDTPPTPETSHPGSRATTWYLHGDHTAEAVLPDARHIDHWYQIAGVDVQTPATPAVRHPKRNEGSASPAAIVALGDSITDGHGATTNGNDRWTDVLAARLQASVPTRSIAVVNQGIGGNHMLTDGLGPNVLARLDRDVLAQPGARWVILFEGVNDLGMLARGTTVTEQQHKEYVARILASYQQVIARAHAQGLVVIGATITPWVGSDYYRPDTANEADRAAVNAWIRDSIHKTAGAEQFDAVLDFDAVVRDPAHPDRMLPAYDSGDHLHPSPAGYKALADSIPLTLFQR